MRLMRCLDMAWRAAKTAALSLFALFMAFGLLAMDYPVWWFFILMAVLCVVPIVLKWESSLYFGSLLMPLFVGALAVVLKATIAGRVMLLIVFGGAALAMFIVYASELWDDRNPEDSFHRFPYRLVGPRRRLELGLELGRSYSGQEHDVEQLVYDDETRDLIREVAHVAPTERVRRAAMAKLCYPDDADLIRKLATTVANQETRLDALLMLPYPEEAKLLEGELRTFPAYERYCLDLGWPHRHHFAFADLTREGTDSNRTETEVSTCTCGMAKVVVSRVTTTERYDRCPNCGGRLEEICPGGGYGWAWQCSDCEWTSDECGIYGDWPPYIETQTEVVSTTYHMKGEA